MSILTKASCGLTLNIGEILVEIIATRKGQGFNQAMDLIGPFPSGAPAIFIDQCAKISKSAAIIGCVGNDDFGRVNINRLKNDGVDISGISINNDYPTGTAFVRYRENGQRDFVFNITKSAATQIHWSESLDKLIERTGHLHVMGTALIDSRIGKIIEKAAFKIKENSGSISLDPNIRKEINIDSDASHRLNLMLDICDLLLPSDEELFITANSDDLEEALKMLFGRGIKEIVLKKGKYGAIVFLPDGQQFHGPGFKVDEVDPTGAGDCFGATYVSCRRLDFSIEKSLKYANAAGAKNVTSIGPMEGTSTLDDLDKFIVSQEAI